MNGFDPTLDHGVFDLKVEENLNRYLYAQLIKDLVILACDADRQRELVGNGHASKDITDDLYSHFMPHFEKYLDAGLLTQAACDGIGAIDTIVYGHADDDENAFWDDAQMATHPDWIQIRKMAQEVLTMMGYGDLRVEMERKEQFEDTETGPRMIMQWTRTYLVR